MSTVQRRLGLLAAALLVLAACGVGTDDSPRDIPAVDQKELGVNTDRGAGATTGTARIYLLSPVVSGQGPTLQPVARDVPETPTEVLTSLFGGANTNELARQFRTAIPGGTRMLSARLQGGTLRVNVSKELLQLSGGDLVDALAQIVFTASEVEGVRGVKILVDGADQQWPAGDGALQSEPLTVYDYPGLVVSAQPAYPAIPTPSQPA